MVRTIALLALAFPTAAFTLPTASPSLGGQPTAPWRNLMPKPGLAGWHRTGGNATYTVVGDELVGRAVVGKGNSWLVSDQLYGDFIVEFDAKTDPSLNSGMMIRGQSRPDYRSGVVFGYQAEIDPSPRAWSAGLYDEQRRQWLYTLGRNEAARNAFRPGDWNHYRVEAIGHRIRTFINGVPAADIVDDTDARGFLAFQVHALPDEVAAKGPEVRFKGLRILTDSPARYALPESRLEQQGWQPNQLTAAERRAGWTLLWDGRSAKGWHSAKGGGFPTRGWTIAQGVLTVDKNGGGGDIATDASYRNFELSVDFRLSEGANSGIKYLLAPAAGGAVSTVGFEYQLLDDARHPDAKMGRDGNRTLASLYDLIPARNLSDPSSPGKRGNPPGEWNRATILVRGDHVEHWLNGFKVVEYTRGSDALKARIAESKFAAITGFGTTAEGAILLQDHGDRVDFRSIKLRRF